MKLTPQNIQFIDNYLKNSQVVYYDIRMEMLDHVATAVEQKMEAENLDFDDAFKNYMVLNKKEILKRNKQGFQFKEPLKKFGLFLIQPVQLLLALAVFVMIYFITLHFGIKDVHYYFYLLIISTYVAFIVHYMLTKNNKFYTIDKNISIVFLLFQIAIPMNKSASESFTSSVVFNSIVLIIYLAFVRFYYLEMKFFKQKNKFLFQ